jgi:hypothetical protein
MVVSPSDSLPGDTHLLTESEVERSFNRLFKKKEINAENLAKAESLIDQLRPESPLRFRLEAELSQLREQCLSENS